jgi:hypothetical protein
MLLGLSPFTWFHTIISLIALVAGFPVLFGLIVGRLRSGWALVFLVTAVATDITGFMFPFDKVLPSHILGVISLVVLALAIFAQYSFHLVGAWRWIYAASIAAAQFFLVFVTIAQAFGKFPALHALAPTQSEPPFAIAEGIALLVFIALGVVAARKFRPGVLPA